MKKNVSLVLSGGGARGIAHIGVIEELVETGRQAAIISLKEYSDKIMMLNDKMNM